MLAFTVLSLQNNLVAIIFYQCMDMAQRKNVFTDVTDRELE